MMRTFTEHFFPLPSLAFAVTVTVFPFPLDLVVTTPLLFTVAYLVLLQDHVTERPVAFAGEGFAFRVVFLPAAIVKDGLA